MRKLKGSQASFNFVLTWYGSARKPQLENRDKLQDLKVLQNFVCIEKMKYLAPYNVRKHLAECLILSKIDCNDIVSDPVPDYLVKRLQRVQLTAASFVLGHYATKHDSLIKLAWLPAVKCKEQHFLSNVFKALYFDDWPSYLRLNTGNAARMLRL